MKITRIDGIYAVEEQIEIVWKVGGIKGEYKRLHCPRKRQYYFRQLAEEYSLAERIKLQLEFYRSRELATIGDIANLFGVSRSAVSRYLKPRLSSEDLENLEDACWEQGSRRGGQNSSTKGYKQKRTWSRKKKS